MTTWDVWERLLLQSRGTTIVRERQVAVCATREQALAEMRRLAEDEATDESIPEDERTSWFVKRGALMIGLEVVP